MRFKSHFIESKFSINSLFFTLLGIFFFGGTPIIFAQKPNIERIDPPHWWAGLQQDTLYLLVKGSHLAEGVALSGTEAQLLSAELSPSKEYIHLHLWLPKGTPSGTITLEFGTGKNTSKVRYELKPRKEQGQFQGLSQSDFIYLITPDRFANGNTKNDVVKGMYQTKIDREAPFERHGGDIEGIFKNLDYIQKLGVTAIWSNPLLENNQPEESYHGYAITDHYKIDPRFGTNGTFRDLVDAGHQKGIKTIMDMVYNHIGDRHYLFTSPPDSSWFNWWPEFQKTNYRATSLLDPYASEADKKIMTDGWFDNHMPDLNQRHPLVAKWLIQNSIWLIENFDLDGFRIDTYAYPEQDFMTQLNAAILKQYPNFFLFGETWVHGHQVQSWFPQGNPGPTPNTNLHSVTDFQLHYAINDALIKDHGWAEGINRVYYTLAADWLYQHPENLVTFVDNHDLPRFYGVIGRDLNKFKIGMGMLLTLRGIPSMYYGTEILLHETENHGKIRQDFPGGWKEDAKNKFEIENRTGDENQALSFIRTLANYRKTSPALTEGRLIQFVPDDGVYVYFWIHENQKVMVVVNATNKMRAVKLERFEEVLGDFTKTRSVLTGFELHRQKFVNTAEYSITILELLD
jgi:neopullulanase